MNIVISINQLDMGGAAHMVYELVKNINKSIYKVKIVCFKGKTGSYLEEQMVNENHDIVFLKNPRLNGRKPLSKVINKLFSVCFDIVSIKRLYNELSELKPDIVHAHQDGIFAGYWTIFHNTPLITTVHSRPDGCFGRISEKIILWLSISLHHNILVAISKYNLNAIISYWHLDSKYAFYVNNGINIDNSPSVHHETITFINVSRQDKNKNQSLILRAFSKLYHENPSIPMKLYLVGDGKTHNSLIKEAESLEILKIVTFTGYIASATEYLAISDVYISSANREGLGLSVLEAMAAGLPVIATDAGGVRDLAGENGFLIPCNDEYALYASMKELRDNDELRLFKGKKSLEMVQDYSAVNMTNKYCNLYNDALESK
jgi:glycosyltransferase involved in cell wall biosynthesis